jgi:hypothetical protein
MAYLDTTVLNDFQALQATNEKLVGKFGMIDLAKASTASVDYVPPSVKEKLATISASRTATIPVIKDQTVTVVTTPGFQYIPTNLAETAEYSFSAFDVFTGFRMYPASFDNNVMDAAYYRDNVLKNVLLESAKTVDDIIETQLEARKTQTLSYTTQVSQGDGTFTWDDANDWLEINKAAQKETMFANLSTLMDANKQGGEYRMVTSPAGLQSSVIAAAKYGAANDKNIAWDANYLALDRRYESHQLAPSSDNFHGFFVKDGGIGLFENFPYDFRNGTMLAGKSWSISDVTLPFVNLRANVYVNTEATEATSLVSPNTDTNLTMTHFEEMALWFRFYVVYRYNSALATRPNDIVKLIGLTT